MVDIVLIPKRLKDSVGEAERQQILHGLLAHIVIYAICLVFAEDTGNFAIEFLGGGQVSSKGFLNHNACPGILVTVQALWTG